MKLKLVESWPFCVIWLICELFSVRELKSVSFLGYNVFKMVENNMQNTQMLKITLLFQIINLVYMPWKSYIKVFHNNVSGIISCSADFYWTKYIFAHGFLDIRFLF